MSNKGKKNKVVRETVENIVEREENANMDPEIVTEGVKETSVTDLGIETKEPSDEANEEAARIIAATKAEIAKTVEEASKAAAEQKVEVLAVETPKTARKPKRVLAEQKVGDVDSGFVLMVTRKDPAGNVFQVWKGKTGFGLFEIEKERNIYKTIARVGSYPSQDLASLTLDKYAPVVSVA